MSLDEWRSAVADPVPAAQRPAGHDSFSIVEIAQMDSRWLREQLGCAWAATTIDALLEELRRAEGDFWVARQVAAERGDEIQRNADLIKELRFGYEVRGRTIDLLKSERDKARTEAAELRSQRRSVLDLCDAADARFDERDRLYVEGKRVSAPVAADAVRGALGAGGDTPKGDGQ